MSAILFKPQWTKHIIGKTGRDVWKKSRKCFNIKATFLCIMIPIIKIRLYDKHLIFTKGISILVTQYLHSEMAQSTYSIHIEVLYHHSHDTLWKNHNPPPPTNFFSMISWTGWRWMIKSGFNGVENDSVIMLSSRNNYPTNLLATLKDMVFKKGFKYIFMIYIKISYFHDMLHRIWYMINQRWFL